jgi:hypothetical protein
MSLCHLKHAQACALPDCDSPSLYCSLHSLPRAERIGALKLLNRLRESPMYQKGCDHTSVWAVCVAFEELFPEDDKPTPAER